jgi:hypothetical protein
MDRLFAMYEPVDLLERIDFDSVSRKLTGTEAKGRRALFQPVLIDGAAPEAASDPEPARVVITQIAYIPKGCSIPPHGHSNMVSAFLHLSGRFRVRQYDKLADYCDALVIRRSGEAVGGAGQWSSMSDVRNNVHWVTALTDDCYLFSTKVILEEAKPYHGRINIDIRAASEVGGGVLRAPKISGERADELYDSSA